MTAKDGKSSWGSGVSLEKRELFEERLETILLILKHRFPGISQSSLDISKIEHNQVRINPLWVHTFSHKRWLLFHQEIYIFRSLTSVFYYLQVLQISL